MKWKLACLKELHVYGHYWGSWRGNKECGVLFNTCILRRLDGKQINHQVYLKLVDMNCLAINYYSVNFHKISLQNQVHVFFILTMFNIYCLNLEVIKEIIQIVSVFNISTNSVWYFFFKKSNKGYFREILPPCRKHTSCMAFVSNAWQSSCIQTPRIFDTIQHSTSNSLRTLFSQRVDRMFL